MSDLNGKVAVVTGAAQGIGAAIVKRLAADGATIAALDLQADHLAGTVEEVERMGGQAIGITCDVSDSDAVNAAFERIGEELGSVDVLVNNAGVLRDNLLFKMSDEDWDLVIRVHLRGSFLCSRAAQAFMVKQKWGKIVSLSSLAADGNRGQLNYSTAKAGLQGFTRTLARELGPFNVNVNAIAPGFIETAMTRAVAERIGMDYDALKEESIPNIPLRRIGRPEDVANVVSFLCSEDSSYVSGQTIYITGGETA